MKRMLKNKFLPLLLTAAWSIIITSPLLAQQPEPARKAKIFVANNFSDPLTTAVHVKWVLSEVIPDGGVNIYRSDAGKNNWQKLNSEPLGIVSSPPDTMRLDPEIKGFYEKVKKPGADPKGRNIVYAFAAAKAMNSNNLAHLMGIYYIDRTVEKGSSYQYKVVSIEKGIENDRGVSPVIKAGPWVPDKPVDDFEVKRGIKGAGIKWKHEPMRYYGVNIYKTTSVKGAKVKLTKNPLLLTPDKSTGKYPEFLFSDFKVSNDSVYYYQAEAIDFFGQPTALTEMAVMPRKDLFPPKQPFALDYKTDTLRVRIRWMYILDSVPDLSHFRVFRSDKFEGPYEAVSKKLSRTDTVFFDFVPEPNEWFYYVSAYDSALNDAPSVHMLVDVRDVVPPAIPSGFKVQADSGKMIFTWQPNKEKDLAGYYLYKALKENVDNYYVINKKPIEGNVYNEKMSKKTRNEFVYQVVAVDKSGNRSPKSKPVFIRLPDVTPPGQPFIKNIENVNNGLMIQWVPNADPDINYYQLYRLEKFEDKKPPVLVKEKIANTDTAYFDTETEPNKIFGFTLVAIDSAGNRSKPSNAYPAKLIKQSKGVPVEKFEAGFNKRKGIVTLSWKVNFKGNFQCCVVFRRMKGEDEAIPITGKLTTSLEAMDYNDSSAQKGKTYLYHIRSYSNDGVTNLSEEKEVEVPKEN